MVLSVAAAIVVLGETLCAQVRSPLLRLLIAIFFAAPAGLAAFPAVHGMTAALVPSTTWPELFACLAALVVATVAALRLGSAPPGDPDQGEGGRVSGGDLARPANDP